jgi:Tol biopolymer transport system component
MRQVFLRTALIVAAFLPGIVANRPQSPPGQLTIDALVDIRHPNLPAWSPDATQLVFVWERAGVGNLFRVAAVNAHPGSPQPLTKFDEGHVDSVFWSRDGRTIYFMRLGDLWQMPADGSSPASRVLSTGEAEDEVTMSPDGSRIAFVRGGSPDVI